MPAKQNNTIRIIPPSTTGRVKAWGPRTLTPIRRNQKAPNAGTVSFAFWMTLQARTEWHVLARRQGRSAESLAREAFDMMFERHGRPPLAQDAEPG